jgi:coiled-coil domain-containing protein 12
MADASDRKARLAAIRANASTGKGMENAKDNDGDKEKATAETVAASSAELPVKFRNYNPQDTALQPKKRPHPEEGADATTDVAKIAKTEEPKNQNKNQNKNKSNNKHNKKNKVEEQDQDIIARELRELASDEINIVPKKPNWDLKNQVSAKLEKLRRRTQRAIVDVLREKVALDAQDDNID